MPEQKKPKIDLKARLGKKTVGSPSGAGVPPPVGIPKPPPMMGMPGGPGKGPPKVDASDPYAAIGAEHAKKSEPKAIKVEMSEEVVQAQKKGKARIIAITAAAAVVAGIIGFAFGSGYQRGKGADVALAGAQELVKEVDAANVEANQLSEVLGQAAEKLGNNEFPDEALKKLGGINIPFQGANLVGKGIGRFKADVVTMLIDYAGKAQRANDQKERIQRILGGARKGVMELLSQKSKPKVRWAVFVRHGPHGPWANMQPLPKPFLVDKKEKDKDGKAYDWPEEFEIKEGNQTHKLKRYKKGEPAGGDAELIPVAPETQSAVCPDSTMVRLRKELVDMQKVLKGDQTPGVEETGLLELGEALTEALKKIGAPS